MLSTGRRLPQAWRWIRRDQQSLLILCYHGVSTCHEHIWDPRLYIPADVFRGRMAAIRDFGYHVLPLDEALSRLEQKRLPGPTAVLTFDDGWHDFYSVAWPILREFNFPATVYQTSYYSRYNQPVFDTACRYLLWTGKGRMVRGHKLIAHGADLDLTSDARIQHAWRLLSAKAEEKNLSGEQKNSLLERLARAVGTDYEQLRALRILHLMSANEIRVVSQAGVDVELHTHRHHIPSDRKLFLRELEQNREWIESATKKPARNFCYPNGLYRPEVLTWLREAGIRCATTCEPGVAKRQSEPLLLPRFTDAGSISQAKFESWLTGVGRIAPVFRRTLRRVLPQARTPRSFPVVPAGIRPEPTPQPVRTPA